jgi:hypothetical protein
MRTTLYLVGCSATKLDHAALARDLYTGRLFKAARRYVEAQGPRARWGILSGRYGLLPPTAVLEPYDARVPRPGRSIERRAWEQRVKLELERELVRAGGRAHELRVVWLAGDDYARGVETWLGRIGVRVERPLKGLGIGQQMRWLTEHTGGRAECLGHEQLTGPIGVSPTATALARRQEARL